MAGLNLRVGELIEVRSKAEILATLDKNGQMEGLPFMPAMFQHCGRQFRVFKRAHKTCDTVNQTGGRRMANAVHLELRCDGQAYGGCQAACLIFWKEAWLRRATPAGAGEVPQSSAPPLSASCSESDVWAGTRNPGPQNVEDTVFVCQATQVPAATTPLNWWEMSQYAEDFSSGNVGIGMLFRGAVYASYYNLSNAGIGIGGLMRWLYDRFQALSGGVPYPRKCGVLPAGQRTPPGVLNLQPGEWVRVKPYEEILATLDTHNKNRGLYFDAEAVPYCGGIYRVLSRVNRIVDEKTGKLLKFKNECVILEGVWCQARYSDRRMLCPRAIYSYWREIWLERAAPPDGGVPPTRSGQSDACALTSRDSDR